MVAFLKELPELGWVSQFKCILAQGPILHLHNHKAQDRVCSLGVMPIISGHAGNLQTIPYWVKDEQVIVLCLNRTHRAFRVASCTAHTTTAVTQLCVPKVSGTLLGQDTTLNKASTSMLIFPAL